MITGARDAGGSSRASRYWKTLGRANAPSTRHFAEEHLAGAINIPLKELDERSAARLDRARPVIVYCHDLQ
ncbi:MAG: rhodanese-like domain-containing protein [Chloroflexi bacterium]|nr:MAG: rhodanese-like domain-containing protein [Chloroflexota bacterium]